MKGIRHIVLAAVVGAWVTAGGPARAASPAPDGAGRDVRFQWAVIKRGADGEQQYLPARKPLQLQAGDSLKLYLRTETNLCLYVLLLDSEDALYALSPAAGESAPILAAGAEAVIPAGEQWFELDRTKGVETFHVLASPKRLTTLEALCRKLRPIGQPQDAQAQKAVLEELRALSRQHSRLAGGGEKPISIAGTIRSVGGTPAPEVNQVTATGLASKLIQVEHQ